MVKNRTIRILLVCVGSLSLALGIIGIAVPLLPTTPFLLLAAACYVRSSDRLYRWLLNHRWFGNYIRGYLHHRAVSMRAKVSSLALLWICIGYAVLFVAEAVLLQLLLIVIAECVTAHILSLKTLTAEMLENDTTGDDTYAT